MIWMFAIPVGIMVVCFAIASMVIRLKDRSVRGCDICAGTSLAIMRRMPPCPRCGRTA